VSEVFFSGRRIFAILSAEDDMSNCCAW